MFTKVSSVLARIIASSHFHLGDVSWNLLNEAENLHEQQENQHTVFLFINGQPEFYSKYLWNIL